MWQANLPGKGKDSRYSWNCRSLTAPTLWVSYALIQRFKWPATQTGLMNARRYAFSTLSWIIQLELPLTHVTVCPIRDPHGNMRNWFHIAKLSIINLQRTQQTTSSMRPTGIAWFLKEHGGQRAVEYMKVLCTKVLCCRLLWDEDPLKRQFITGVRQYIRQASEAFEPKTRWHRFRKKHVTHYLLQS